MNGRKVVVGLVLGLMVGAGAASATSWTLAAICGLSGSGGDFSSRGIYLTNYPGVSLGQVELAYWAQVAGLYRITLTARQGGFDGPVIGAPQVATVELNKVGDPEVLVVFDFSGAPVTPGDTITFTHEVEGLAVSGSIFFDIGAGTCSNVFETGDTTPPLDGSPVRDTVGLLVTSQDVITSCVPSDTVMCIDDAPGDHRFKLTAAYKTSEGGGLAGQGGEIPLSTLGVVHGGLFWFFDSTNPEAVVKIVNGCSVNLSYWVFISAGTNVGFEVTITDTLFNTTKTYTNPDLTAAVPVQDTSAFKGCV